MTEEERTDALLCIDTECKRMERLSQKMMQFIALRQENSLMLIPGSVPMLLDCVQAACAEQLKSGACRSGWNAAWIRFPWRRTCSQVGF